MTTAQEMARAVRNVRSILGGVVLGSERTPPPPKPKPDEEQPSLLDG